MRITIFGANGRVGSLVVKELLKRGHSVTAFVHGATNFANDSKLTVIDGDIYDGESVSNAVAGAELIVSALGSWGTKNKDILSQGMKRIVPAAKTHHVTRIISLTGADARASGDKLSILHHLTHLVFSIIAGKVLRDGEHHIQTLEHSSLEWTVLRSPVMKDTGSHTYTLNSTRPMPWHTIPRAAVVEALCDMVESDAPVASAPYIHRA